MFRCLAVLVSVFIKIIDNENVWIAHFKCFHCTNTRAHNTIWILSVLYKSLCCHNIGMVSTKLYFKEPNYRLRSIDWSLFIVQLTCSGFILRDPLNWKRKMRMTLQSPRKVMPKFFRNNYSYLNSCLFFSTWGLQKYWK